MTKGDNYYQICFSDVIIEAETEEEAHDIFWKQLKETETLEFTSEHYTEKQLIADGMESYVEQ